MTYTINYKIVERDNGRIDVYDANGNLRYGDISKIGFVQVLESIIVQEEEGQ